MIFADCVFSVLMSYCYDRPPDEQGGVAGRKKFCAARNLHLSGGASVFQPPPAMKHIKLSGREQAVLRAIDYASGSTGEEIHTTTHIDPDELADILNGLCDAGYVEVFPYAEHVTPATCPAARFEVNPSYALELKEALRRR